MGAGRSPHVSGKLSLRPTEADCSENCGKISDRARHLCPVFYGCRFVLELSALRTVFGGL
eukprot:3783454-Prymnesium_polylepis.2